MVSVSANIVYKYPSQWDRYFYIVRKTLWINEKGYEYTKRRMNLKKRVTEFIMTIYVIFTMIRYFQ